MHETMHYKTTHRAKVFIERLTGLSLADAVNVAIFLLTILSLLLAGAGVAVAYWTLRDAHEAGEEQKKSLDKERETLEGLQATLQHQETTLSTNLQVAKEEQQRLNESIEVSKGQLNILRQQNERSLASPRLKIDGQCTTTSNGKTLSITFTVDVDNQPTTDQMHIGRDGDVYCFFSLNNSGNAILQSGYVQERIIGFASAGNIVAQIFTPGGNAEAKDFDYYEDVVKDRQVFPGSENEVGWKWKINVPDFITTIEFTFRLGGTNHPERSYDLVLPVWHDRPLN